MYKIFADDTLIYDSTLEDYRIGKGSITLETNKSGSFTFSLYPDHFYYDNFVRLKTVITVFKSGKIVFRGRILNDVTDYWNNKVLTCEGELGFLQDSIIRPFSFSGTPEELFRKFIEEHNSQVDEFKRFKIGRVTIADSNNYIARSNSSYESALSNLNSRLIEDSLGGYFYITHGEDGDERTPTINYIADFTKVATQVVEFGSNLKNYTKTVKGEDIATAIIPLGKTVDDGDSETEDPKLTIKDVNNGLDYVYSQEGVALYGWIFKVVSWDDVTDANNLKNKAKAYVEESVKQNITIELNAIDLHLLDKSIESFCVGDYIRVVSTPHNFDSTLLCNKQTIDLLKPENDSLVLGYTYAAFSERQNKISSSVKIISGISDKVDKVSNSVTDLNQTVTENEQIIYNDIEAVALAVTENARNIANNASDIDAIQETITKTALVNLIYPVGSIYLSVNSTSPQTLFGGTWERVKDKFILAAGDTYSAGTTGGEATHTLTINEMPKHMHDGITTDNLVNSHRMKYGNAAVPASGNGAYWSILQTTGTDDTTARTIDSGGGAAHNNMPPYLVVYMWRRTA